MATLWHDLATNWNTNKRDTKEVLKNEPSHHFSLFFAFNSSPSWKFRPQLAREYAPFAFLVYVWLNFIEGKSENL